MVDVRLRGKSIAAVYYHWSAYTDATLDELKNLINAFAECDVHKLTVSEAQLQVIEAVQQRRDEFNDGASGGVCADDFAYAKSRFPDAKLSEHISRNEGLVALRPKTQESLWQWAEGSAALNISAQTFHTYVWTPIDEGNLDWWGADYIAEARQQSGPSLDRDFKWSEIDGLIDAVDSAPSAHVDKNGKLLSLDR